MEVILQWLGTLPGAAGQGLVWGLMAIGLYITYKILDLADLTVDGSICTGAAVCAVLLTSGVNIWLAMLCSLLAGMLAGLVTGWLHTVFGIPAILAGILTQLMLWSVNLLVMKGSAIVAITRLKYADKVLITSGDIDVYRTIVILAVFVSVIVAALYWFFGTDFGASLRATGNNPEMSRAQGINTNMTKVFGLALSNGIVALSGALLAQQQGAAEINMGRGAIVIGLAAIIIGEVMCPKLVTNFAIRLLCVAGGAIIYWFVFQTVVFLGLPSELLKMLSALVVACFLGIPYVKKTYFSKKKKTEVKRHA
ncbi:MAG: ABC transporter permease [Clostridia bacterium]|nr:ABC transporter permease [Clostridia bacterium]MBQ2249344.1 ABC transporter permease [Clostridia bacterium]MBQ5893018.1 ABC transporter permease [Clostridia bacterium]